MEEVGAAKRCRVGDPIAGVEALGMTLHVGKKNYLVPPNLRIMVPQSANMTHEGHWTFSFLYHVVRQKERKVQRQPWHRGKLFRFINK